MLSMKALCHWLADCAHKSAQYSAVPCCASQCTMPWHLNLALLIVLFSLWTIILLCLVHFLLEISFYVILQAIVFQFSMIGINILPRQALQEMLQLTFQMLHPILSQLYQMLVVIIHMKQRKSELQGKETFNPLKLLK